MNKKIMIPIIAGLFSFPLLIGMNEREDIVIENDEKIIQSDIKKPEKKKTIKKNKESDVKKELEFEQKLFDYEEELKYKQHLKDMEEYKNKKKEEEKKQKPKEEENKKPKEKENKISQEEYQALLDKENEASNTNLEQKESIANQTINLTEQELKARAQFLKDDNGGWVPEGELEPYDLAQPNPADLIIYQDNSNLPIGDTYNNYFIDKEQAFNNSVVYSYPYGPIYPLETESRYTIDDLEYHGAMIWNGYKYTFYSQKALPGGAMQIPGRHIEDGFVVDSEGYITAASDYYPKGTILDSPFGRPIKIRDVFWHNQPEYRIDIYTR